MYLKLILVFATLVALTSAGVTVIEHIGTHVFVVSDSQDKADFKGAEKICKTLNRGHLASIVTPKEQKLVEKMLREEPNTDLFWVGLRRDDAELPKIVPSMKGKSARKSEKSEQKGEKPSMKQKRVRRDAEKPQMGPMDVSKPGKKQVDDKKQMDDKKPMDKNGKPASVGKPKTNVKVEKKMDVNKDKMKKKVDKVEVKKPEKIGVMKPKMQLEKMRQMEKLMREKQMEKKLKEKQRKAKAAMKKTKPADKTPVKPAFYRWLEHLPPRLRMGIRMWKLDHVPTMKCVHMTQKGELESCECNMPKRYICKLRANVCPPPHVFTVDRNMRVPLYTNRVRPIIYLSEVSYDYNTAKKFCQVTGAEYPVYPVPYRPPMVRLRKGHLASILRKSENDFLAKHLLRIRIMEAKKRSKHNKNKILEEKAVGYYIGGYRKSADKVFSWDNKIFPKFGWYSRAMMREPVPARKLEQPWGPGEPDGKDTINADTDSNCVLMGELKDASRWTDADCERRARFICKYFCPVPVRRRRSNVVRQEKNKRAPAPGAPAPAPGPGELPSGVKK